MLRSLKALLVLCLASSAAFSTNADDSQPVDATMAENTDARVKTLQRLVSDWKGREDFVDFPVQTTFRKLDRAHFNPETHADVHWELTELLHAALKQQPQPMAYAVARRALTDARNDAGRITALWLLVNLGTKQDDVLASLTDALSSSDCTSYEADFIRHNALPQLFGLGTATVDEIGRRMIAVAVRQEIKASSRAAALESLSTFRWMVITYRGTPAFQRDLRNVTESLFLDPKQPTDVRNGAATILATENSLSPPITKLALELAEDLQQDPLLRRSAFRLLNRAPDGLRGRCINAAIRTLDQLPGQDGAKLGIAALDILKTHGSGAETERAAVERLLKGDSTDRTLIIRAYETAERLGRLADQ